MYHSEVAMSVISKINIYVAFFENTIVNRLG